MIKDKLCLCGCGKPLRGKQGKFSSDACRMRYNRRCSQREQDEHESEQNCSGIVRESFAFDRETFGNRSLYTNRREFTVTFSIVFVSGRNPGEWDMGLLDVSIKAEMERIIKSYLEYEHQGWQVTVKLTSNPQFRPFE
jgi:hypothetical protein